MSWRFVYCPSCGHHQEKIGDAEEYFFCSECCHDWIEDAPVKTKPKKKKKRK